MSVDVSSFNINRAAYTCRQGGVIAYPTESVYGLGCNPLNLDATEKILSLKNRAIEKGLILIAANIEQLLPYIAVSKSELEILGRKQKSPTTWLVKPSALTPYWITGQHIKVAVRITEHSVCKQLCEKLPYPLVSTSANPGKKSPAPSCRRARAYFRNSVDFYLSGKTGDLRKPTQIIDLETNTTIRHS